MQTLLWKCLAKASHETNQPQRWPPLKIKNALAKTMTFSIVTFSCEPHQQKIMSEAIKALLAKKEQEVREVLLD